MKKFTKALAVFLALIMTFSTFAMAGAADSSDSVTVKMMNFNVAGLPNFGGILGLNDVDISANQKVAAAYMNENDFDIVAVQEDFGYHKSLVSSLEGYNYLTNHTGSFLGGDGMNIFTKNMPIYNETRNKWNASSGVIEDGADELANKGILYAVIDIGNGIYVDFYDIHADAYDSEKDQAAREDNYRQVTDLINANYEKNNRPVVITGDFNHFFHATDKQNSNIRHYFIEKCGLRDAWVELYNDGKYGEHDFGSWWEKDQGGDYYWGRWDSVEKFMYKNGGGVEISVDDFYYEFVLNDKGARVSDHAAAICSMTFTKTEDFVENTQELKVVPPQKKEAISTLMWVLIDLAKIFANFDQVLGLINGSIKY